MLISRRGTWGHVTGDFNKANKLYGPHFRRFRPETLVGAVRQETPTRREAGRLTQQMNLRNKVDIQN